MEQNKHDPNDPDDARLFAMMDEILADAHGREMEAAISRRELVGRQANFLTRIRPLFEAPVIAGLDVLYGEDSDRNVTAGEVLDSLMNDYDDEEMSAEDRRGIEYLYNLSDIVLEATEGQIEDGEFTPSYKKSEVQLSVLDSDTFTYRQKHSIIAIIDDVMPGDTLDIYDPAIVTEALARRHAIVDFNPET